MFVIREVFRCKPGRARQLVEKLRATIPSTEQEDGFRNCRLMVDFVADYWTVVWEAEVDHLEQLERHMASYGSRPVVREAMAGYMDLLEGGRREIYRLI